MKFARPNRRRMTESVVPMINVVFLLLIFFMMSARIAPPPPFDMTLPVAAHDAPLDEKMTLYLSAEGVAGLGGQTGAQAWAALAAADKQTGLTLRGDAQLPAPQLASVLARLARLGFASVDLALRAP